MVNTDSRPPFRLARIDAVNGGAAAFYKFCTGLSLSFDLREKVRQAQTFSISAGGSSFAVPTKLVGVAKYQGVIAALGAIPHRYRKLIACVVPDTRAGKEGRNRVALHFGGDRVGYVQDKHLPWLLPMIPTTATGQIVPGVGIEFFALHVTGGEWDRPMRGLNVVVTGTGERAQLLLDRLEREAEEAEAEAQYEAKRPLI